MSNDVTMRYRVLSYNPFDKPFDGVYPLEVSICGITRYDLEALLLLSPSHGHTV